MLTLRDLTQWFTFWDSFIAAVHNNSQLVGVDTYISFWSRVESNSGPNTHWCKLQGRGYNTSAKICQSTRNCRRLMFQLLKVESVTLPHNVIGLCQLLDWIHFGWSLVIMLLEIQLLISRKVLDIKNTSGSAWRRATSKRKWSYEVSKEWVTDKHSYLCYTIFSC